MLVFLQEKTVSFDGWQNIFKQLKLERFDSIDNFQKLNEILPGIQHEKIFTMRLTMYKRWFPSQSNLFKVFINQIIEYLMMGEL